MDQLFWDTQAKASVTGFLTKIDHITQSLQLSEFVFQRVNGGHRLTKGLEMALSLTPFKPLTMKTSLTLTQSQDSPHKIRSPLIPSFKVAEEIQWRVLSELSFFIQGYYVNSRQDAVTHRRLSPFGLVNIGGAYDVSRNANLFFRLENITNKRFEEVFGYGSRGRAVFFGIEAKT